MDQMAAVYDGMTKIGEIVDRGCHGVEVFVFLAGDKRRRLGIFPDRQAAICALPIALGTT
jgi:hypothetical protein